MRHDPNNSQCDKNQYGDAPDVRCTCDVDDPADAPVPSTVVAAAGAPMVEAMHRGTAAMAARLDGAITLTGRSAATHHELRSAGLEMKAAQDLYRRAEERYKRALDAHMLEIMA